MNLSMDQLFKTKFPTSYEYSLKASQFIPGGVTHEGRFLRPFPLYLDRGLGSRKWDVDDNQFIDYWMGHGALLLGHSHPAVLSAVKQQIEKGTHLGGCHKLEIDWAEQVCRLVPCAERVRFFSSGTEATLMAFRLARSYTRKNKIIKFQGHFHGWHDYVTLGISPPFHIPVSPGIPAETLQNTILLPPNDIEAVIATVESDSDIAGIILEPSGGAYGTVPTRGDFLHQLREVTAKHGQVLIFDEVITGFRLAPGGAQEYYGVKADLATLAKILAGGFPGGAVAGRKEILEQFEFRTDFDWNRFQRISHPGTFNANPVSAVAGIVALKAIATGEETRKAGEMGEKLRSRLNSVLEEVGLPWCVYGHSSLFHFFTQAKDCSVYDSCSREECLFGTEVLTAQKWSPVIQKLRAAMILNGVDIPSGGGWLSAKHSAQDIEDTAEAFRTSLKMVLNN